MSGFHLIIDSNDSLPRRLIVRSISLLQQLVCLLTYLRLFSPFLNTVTDLPSFDNALQEYVTQGYVESQ